MWSVVPALAFAPHTALCTHGGARRTTLQAPLIRRVTAPLASEPPADDEDDLLPIEKLRAVVEAGRDVPRALDAALAEEVREFLNDRHTDDLLAWATSPETDVGKQCQNKNAWSRGSWVPKAAQAVAVSQEAIELTVEIAVRGQSESKTLTTTLPFGARCETADALRLALLRLSHKMGRDSSSGSLLSLPGASDRWSLPADMWLNSTPTAKSVRNMFYNDVTAALQAAVADPACPRRMRVHVSPPEL